MRFSYNGIKFQELLWLIVLFTAEMAGAQSRGRISRLAEEARRAWEQRDLVKAEQAANKVLIAEKDNLDIHLLLAEIYREQNNPALELAHLESAADLPGKPILVYFRLSETYFSIGEYDKAHTSINKYLEGNSSKGLIGKAEQIRKHSAFSKEAIKNPVEYNPVNLGTNINTKYDEYWPSITIDGSTLIFTRLLPMEGIPKLKQEDFYLSIFDGVLWSEAEPVNSINSNLNEGAQTISVDGSLLFFTLCNHPEGFGSCDIWYSVREDGNWSKPRNAGRPLNSESWEGQPSLSAFGDRLYFASNRPGGKGNKDIWSIELKGWRPDGKPIWGEFKNLGDSINTPGDDISPFIHQNNRDLFFSSDYWPGFGGFDLFRSQQKPDVTWTQARNLGFPVNSPGNEQGLVIDRKGLTAYMASNRIPGNGMDIYSFALDESLRPAPVTFIQGIITDAESQEPVSAMVKLTGLEKDAPVELILKADAEGRFNVTLPAGNEYAFHVNEPGYLVFSEHIFVEEMDSPEPVYRQISLTPVMVGSQTHLYNIFFDTGSDKILERSEPELNELTGFLLQNPSLQIEIQGHTDNIGTAEFNLSLSENRANSVVSFLIQRGITVDRLSSKGYGYTLPVAPNSTEEGRAKNRRTTVKITGVLPPLQE